MTSEELCEIGRVVYGGRGWQTRLAEALQVDGSTVRRWVSGAVPVPGPVALAVTLLGTEHARSQGEDLASEPPGE